jgi:hypothetical protein
MVRAAVGIGLGYLIMRLFVFATFSFCYQALGAERFFEPGTYEVSRTWIAVSILLSLGAAIVGGFLCASVSRSARAPVILAVLVLVLGVFTALLTPPSNAMPKPRSGDVANYEAMQNEARPTWIGWLNPILGATGVLCGSRLRARSLERMG